MHTNARLEWTAEDEREFLREKYRVEHERFLCDLDWRNGIMLTQDSDILLIEQ
jgi:hypothetical protein